MGSWPFTRLQFGCGRCVAIAGPHIQILDTTSGQILHSTRCASTITCSAVDEKYTYLVTTGDDKKLNVWELNSLELKSSRELPKKATVVQLSRDAQTILVADKFGDVFSYPLHPPSNVPAPAHSQAPEPRKRDSVASHENPHGTLVLGHASIITSFLLSHDGRHILTADRDEHIRVSRYPHGYIIERYCLGHELYVSALCLPPFEQTELVSGGGDPSLHIWDWFSGTLKCRISVADAAKPFLKVKQSRPSWHHSGGDGEGRGRKGKSRGKKGKQTPEEEADNAPAGTQEPGSSSLQATSAAENISQEELVFALAKVDAVQLKDERLLLFTAIGGSALFYSQYPRQPEVIYPVQHIDFSRPVLDFVIADQSRVLVSLDTAWTPPAGTETHDAKAAIVVVEWGHEEFKVVHEASSLVASLNGPGSLDASVAELASLDLYSALALLPKHAEGFEEGEGAGELDSEMRADTPEGSQGEGKKKHAKPAGRLKTKQALLRRQELDQGSSRSASGDERDAKKPKLADE